MRILLATNRRDLGHALSVFLSERHFQVVDVIGDSDLVVASAEAAHADVVLVDWGLGPTASTRIVDELLRRPDGMAVIVLSTSRESAHAREVRATAYATLGDPPDSLIDALQVVRESIP
jgi:DNA-binding response OmpR family regulator